MSIDSSIVPEDQKAERKAKRKAYKRAYHQAWAKTHPEEAVAGWRKWWESNKPKKAAQCKAYREANRELLSAKERARNAARKGREYGLTAQQYADMVKACNGRCPLCKTPFSSLLNERPCVDHCHTTNIVRGILCKMCNLMLGHARDNPKILRAAARYLMQKSG